MRQYVMELIGAFFLTLAVCITGAPMTVGLMFMAMYYIGEGVSGGYYNPALTVAGWMRGVLSVEDMLIYAGVQSVGAFFGVWLFRALTNQVFMPDVMADLSMGMAIFVEVLMSAVFALVMLTVATSKEYKGSVVNGAVIGLTLAAVLMVSSSIINPAIAVGAYLGQLFVDGGALSRELLFVYICSPLVGGALAALGYDYLHPSKGK
ncbi:MAG TPA: aquaporin [Candidatus Babeliales bacterium]|nr:aquaporin [Candidatus Babeliales bacterium]